MAVLITLVVMGLVAGAFALSFKLKKLWPLAVAAIFLAIYTIVQPSYLPKGEVKRSVIPEFERSESMIQDRNLKAKTGEEYDEKRQQMIKEGLPFKQH